PAPRRRPGWGQPDIGDVVAARGAAHLEPTRSTRPAGGVGRPSTERRAAGRRENSAPRRVRASSSFQM
ncbi:MAG TPA: hypothetical protein VD864_17470, partial [Nocardioides sp.]|nr:hypothetical protein [Nocardioides sp.]